MLVVAKLHAYPPTHCAGAEMAAHGLLKALAARGHDVQVHLSQYNGSRKPFNLDGVTVLPAAAADAGFSKAVRRAGAVISHLENVRSAAAAARGWGRPLVVLCHNTFPATFRQMGSGTTALAVYNSQWMAAEADAWFAANPKAVQPRGEIVVRPPVAAKEYRATPGNAITLINLYQPKGGDVLWQLAERMPEHRFLGVVGAYGEQVIRDAPNVEIVEHVPAPEMAKQVYGRTRVLIMPSAYESWGRTGVEALASGIPVVACPTPGLQESLGDAGVFVDRDDLDGWVAALTALDDPAAWEAASVKAKKRSRQLDPKTDLNMWCDAVEALR
ncbi:MAG TPA: glycosyltransferase family 4 protein [Thermopolyspora sp.]|jgi:Glycosyltransferase